MRTTLKRGIGRVNGLNGNGHSALPPAFGPIVRYRQPEPPKRSVTGVILRGFGWLVLAILVVASGAAGGLYLYGHESLQSVSAHTHQLVTAEKNGSRNWTGTPTCGNRCTAVLAMPQGATALVFAAIHRQAPAATCQIPFASRGFPTSSPYRAELLERPPPSGLR